MKYLKSIVIILVVPYIFYNLYVDFLEYKNFYTYEEFKELELHGEKIIVENRLGSSRTGPKCFFKQTFKGNTSPDCVKNLKMVQVNIKYGDPFIYYRGQSNINKSELCEMSLWTVLEGKTSGELSCKITYFRTLEADKIPIGKASVYARKLKEKNTK